MNIILGVLLIAVVRAEKETDEKTSSLRTAAIRTGQSKNHLGDKNKPDSNSNTASNELDQYWDRELGSSGRKRDLKSEEHLYAFEDLKSEVDRELGSYRYNTRDLNRKELFHFWNRELKYLGHSRDLAAEEFPLASDELKVHWDRELGSYRYNRRHLTLNEQHHFWERELKSSGRSRDLAHEELMLRWNRELGSYRYNNRDLSRTEMLDQFWDRELGSSGRERDLTSEEESMLGWNRELGSYRYNNRDLAQTEMFQFWDRELGSSGRSRDLASEELQLQQRNPEFESQRFNNRQLAQEEMLKFWERELKSSGRSRDLEAEESISAVNKLKSNNINGRGLRGKDMRVLIK